MSPISLCLQDTGVWKTGTQYSGNYEAIFPFGSGTAETDSESPLYHAT